ncbi:hypothetical protein [Actinomycetospora aeridis]|uniref:DUF559 domain-containing protein n=1 Tax=Actinomycetospora aeridis TaxID=3129231 RepID=A0ABU8N216_9PSEU
MEGVAPGQRSLPIALALAAMALSACAFVGWWVTYDRAGLSTSWAVAIATALTLVLVTCGWAARPGADPDFEGTALAVAAALLLGSFLGSLVPADAAGLLEVLAWVARLSPLVAVVLGVVLVVVVGDEVDVDGAVAARRRLSVVHCGGRAVRRTRISGQWWFAARDIDEALGRRHTAARTRNQVRDDARQQVRTDLADAELFVSSVGAGDLIGGSRSPMAPELRATLDAPRAVAGYAETRTIAVIEACFPGRGAVRQHPVQVADRSYRVDLYFPGRRVAVECDERGHASYDAAAELRREQDLREALGCEIVRYDPDHGLADAVVALSRLLAEPRSAT